MAACHQVVPDLPATIALGVLATAAAKRAEVAVGETHREPLNLYLAPAAESGERKGPAMREMLFPLQEEERRLIDQARDGIERIRQERAVAEKRLARLQQKAATTRNPAERDRLTAEAVALSKTILAEPRLPQLLLTDSTPEALVMALARGDGRIAWISEEGGNLIEIMGGRYSKTQAPDLDLFLQAYDGGQVRVERVTREGVHLPAPALTIVVTPQPFLLTRMAEDATLRGRGLLARFAFVLPASLVGTRMYRDRPADPVARAAYGKAITTILRSPLPTSGRVPLLRIQGEALECWKAGADRVERAQAEGGELAGIRDWASKHPGRVARIAGLLHLVNHVGGDPFSIPIAPATVENAWGIGEYLEAHARVVFDLLEVEPRVALANRILDWIRRRGVTTFSLRELHQHHRNVGTPQELLPGLQVLEDRGFISEVITGPQKGRGRPRSRSFSVNPHVHKSQNSQNIGAAAVPTPEFRDLRDFCDPGSAAAVVRDAGPDPVADEAWVDGAEEVAWLEEAEEAYRVRMEEAEEERWRMERLRAARLEEDDAD